MENGTVTVNSDFFGVPTDRIENAAEKLGSFGHCMFLIGVESATFTGLEDVLRGVGTKGATLDLKIPRPDEVGMEWRLI
jgi:hypothetical protein